MMEKTSIFGRYSQLDSFPLNLTRRHFCDRRTYCTFLLTIRGRKSFFMSPLVGFSNCRRITWVVRITSYNWSWQRRSKIWLAVSSQGSTPCYPGEPYLGTPTLRPVPSDLFHFLSPPELLVSRTLRIQPYPWRTLTKLNNFTSFTFLSFLWEHVCLPLPAMFFPRFITSTLSTCFHIELLLPSFNGSSSAKGYITVEHCNTFKSHILFFMSLIFLFLEIHICNINIKKLVVPVIMPVFFCPCPRYMNKLAVPSSKDNRKGIFDLWGANKARLAKYSDTFSAEANTQTEDQIEDVEVRCARRVYCHGESEHKVHTLF